MSTHSTHTPKRIASSGKLTAGVVTVTATDVREKSKRYTVYKVEMTFGDRVIVIFRRYNEFLTFYEKLKKQNGELMSAAVPQKLPGKKLFKKFDPDVLQVRRAALVDFISALVNNQILFQNSMVRTFLDLDSSRQSTTTTDSESDEAYGSGQSDRHGSTSSGESGRVNLGASERLTIKPSDFEFLKVIGKGSFGKVLLARHRAEDELYAVKVLNKSHIIRKNETKHIMAERNVLIRNIQHPFLVGLHYSFQTSDKLYFVLDYINGGELFFHIQRERCFSEDRCRFYAAEITSALGYLHSLNIIYRDLKPENILLDCEGHVALTDFGLCKEGIHGRNTTTTFCGTPEYLAPEILQKKPYDRAVDWWCLGSVLYEILFGLPPFYSRNTTEMYENTLNKPLTFRPTNNIISPAAIDILEKLLVKDKDQRLGSDGDVDAIKSHEFFAAIDWQLLEQRRITPPFVPDLAGKLDFKNFDQEFVREQVPASVEKCLGRSQLRRGSQLAALDAFHGFSYVKPKREIFQF